MKHEEDLLLIDISSLCYYSKYPSFQGRSNPTSLTVTDAHDLSFDPNRRCSENYFFQKLYDSYLSNHESFPHALK
jgi:hypothetical protein